MAVLHEAAVDSEHAEGLQLVAAQHRAVVTQDQLGVAVAALHEGRDLLTRRSAFAFAFAFTSITALRAMWLMLL
jgi:hypothetical protein